MGAMLMRILRRAAGLARREGAGDEPSMALADLYEGR